MSRKAMELALEALLADDAVSQPSEFRWQAIVTLEAVLAQEPFTDNLKDTETDQNTPPPYTS